MTVVRAIAHPNIALVKYWGKQDAAGNLPAVPSLSITLDNLAAITEVEEAPADSFTLDGHTHSGNTKDLKLARFLEYARSHHDIPPLRITSQNDFPTAAGLASSAAGFAALVSAINSLCELTLTPQEASKLARAGSASAARSMFGGFVGLTGPDYAAQPIADASYWPLVVIVAITDTQKKSVSSTEGMTISAATSPYYSTWLAHANTDYDKANNAVANKDFAALAQVTEHSTLKMHAVMQTSEPALLYWNAATINCMQTIQELRRKGVEAFFTMDAGPQVKVVCTPNSAPAVQTALSQQSGVVEIKRVKLGGPARLL